MSDNPITPLSLFTQLHSKFPSVQSAAVTHVEANGGDHFFMVVFRADPSGLGKQQQTGDEEGSKKTPKPKKPRKTTKDGHPVGKLHSALNRHLASLLQEPLDWEVFGERDKQHATGGDAEHKNAPGKVSMNAAEEDIVPTASQQDDRFGGRSTEYSQDASDSVDAVFQTLSDMES